MNPIRLYREILKLHRTKLQGSPQKMMLANRYVKKEFRDHRGAKPEFVKEFLREWNKYAIDLQNMGEIGRDLPSKVVSEMSPDQRSMLAKLEREARGGDGGAGAGVPRGSKGL